MSSTRHLAAILFTDIVGYTALMGEDEARAFQLLKANRHLQKPLIEQYHGQWIKEIGDGVLAIFTSATDAVACACTILNETYKVPGLQLRIGIHLGDIVIENGDAFGDGVNIAARLQALAPINGIWLSEAVFQNVFNKKGIEANFVKEETLKNVREPVRIYEVNFKSFSPQEFMSTSHHDEPTRRDQQNIFTTQQAQFQKPTGRRIKIRRNVVVILAFIILAAIPVGLLISHWKKVDIARNSWLPEIQKLVSESVNQYPKAFALTLKAEKYIPDDPELKQLKAKITQTHSIQTKPEGASVFWQDQFNKDTGWVYTGKTPLIKSEFPRGNFRIKIEKPGYETIFNEVNWYFGDLSISLDSVGHLPEDMVRVYGSIAPLQIVGLDQYGLEGGVRQFVQEFLMDKFEVTNKQFKIFLDSGGYRNKSFWDYQIIYNGDPISWEKAMSLFVDETNKPGPSTWQVGTFPDGKENHPVTGISWYEGMAYAKFVHKKLPTVYHWSQVANTIDTWTIIPRSNFQGPGTNPVGSQDNMGLWGVYDIAGNAREWCVNPTQDKSQRFILGGGWNDLSYAYNDAAFQPAWDRSPSNGLRCMITLSGDTCYDQLSTPKILAYRDYSKEKPVNDDLYKIYLRQYAYDHTPLNPKSEVILDSAGIKVERIEMDATYNHERLPLFLYIPKNVSPPYQTIVLFPGSGDLVQGKFDFRRPLRDVASFILKSGRAFAYPILKSCWERSDAVYSDLQNETNTYKQHVVWWVQDIGRCLDYLQTQNEIDSSKFGYFGVSWGSALGPIVCAVDRRFKSAVFHVGGFMQQKTLPEVDPINFTPRVKIPVLMINGKNDPYYPLVSSQTPMFNLLGSGEKSKKWIRNEGGHMVPWTDVVKGTIAWYDQWMGAAK